MFIRKYANLFMQIALVAVLVAGMLGIRKARAESVQLGWVKSVAETSTNFGYDMFVDGLGNAYSTGTLGTTGSFINKFDPDGNLLWFRSIVGHASWGLSVAVDGEGYVFVTGRFEGTMDFNPGPGFSYLSSAGMHDIFVLKLDGSGNFVWAKSIGGAASDEGYKIVLDGNGGLFLTGMFSGTVDFDPGTGTTLLTGSVGGNGFLCKLDTGGNFVWAKNIGGASSAAGAFSLALDGNGNLVLTGGFTNTADFDPGAGEYNLVSLGDHDVFIIKLDSNGEFVWAQNISGTGMDTGVELTLDVLGNVYATGLFNDTVQAGAAENGIILTSAGNDDAFITKLNPEGEFIWAKAVGGSLDDSAWGIAVDTIGNVFTTGLFVGTADFDPGAGVSSLTSVAESWDIFISKLDTDGNFVWAKGIGGNSYENGEAIAVDAAGHVYIAGEFAGTVDFDPGPGINSLTSAGAFDAFVSKLVITQQTYYVKSDATGANNGSSWTDAYTDLQSALSAASSGDEIWVAAGTYKPTTGIDRNISFTLRNGVTLYGGFAGTETLLSQRNFEVNTTVLSGDIGIIDNNSDNSYHVVIGSNTDASAILDGFTITHGNANTPDAGVAHLGGGMYNTNGSPTLTHLIFTDNSAVWGGGMANEDHSNPILKDVTFSENTAQSETYIQTAGGGMFNTNSSPSLENVTFYHNSAAGGGGLFNATSSPTLVNVTFAGNTAEYGSGIYSRDMRSRPVLNHVTLHSNSATSPEMEGGAIADWGGIIIKNSILWGNAGGNIVLFNLGTADVSYSIVEGGYTGTGNMNVDPLLGPLQDNGGFTQTMALGDGSPAIDAGDDVNCPDTDQRGVTRLQGNHCDIGSYEYVFSPFLTHTPTLTVTKTATATATATITPTLTRTPTPTNLPPLFNSYVNYPAGDAEAVAIGDFNSDGLPDVAVTNSMTYTSRLSIFLQKMDGSLDTPIIYDAGYQPYSIAVGDLNNDERTDIVVTNMPSKEISVFLQQVDGSLASRVTYSTGNAKLAVAVGDLNSDGLDDIALSGNELDVFTQNAEGTLNPRVTYSVPGSPTAIDDIAIADVNNDGRNDVIKKHGFPGFVVYLQQNDGTLAAGISYPSETCQPICGIGGLAAGDVTGDGLDDIVVTLRTNRPDAKIAVFVQTQDGTLDAPVLYTAYDIPLPVEIADINQDNRADVLTAHDAWSRVGVFLQQANGTLGLYRLFGVPYADYTSYGMAVGDINSDGLPDVAIASGNSGLVVLYHVLDSVPNTPTFTVTPTLTLTSTATATVTVTPTSTATEMGTATQTQTATATPTSTSTRTATMQPVAKPGIPVLLVPANGALVSSLQPVLDWKDSSPAAHYYQVQVSTTSEFTALVNNESNVSLSTFTPPSDLTAGKLYYWRVRGFNVNGVASAWSIVRNFKTPLAQPVHVAPSNGVPLTVDRPTFDWNAVDDAGQYLLQVSAQSNFSTLLVNATVTGTEYTMGKDLPQDKILYWRVRGKTTVVTGPWSATWTFRTGNPPTVPVLASPANGSLVKDYTPRLNWNDSKVPAGTSFKHYELQVDDQSNFSSPVIETTRTISEFAPLAELASNTKYYWRVRAVNTIGSVDHVSGWSPVWSFRTVIQPPQSLIVIPGETLQQPSFDWDDATGTGAITGYTIQVSTRADFSTLLVNATVKESFYALGKNLPFDRTIYWRVRINGANGPSSWRVDQFSISSGLP